MQSVVESIPFRLGHVPPWFGFELTDEHSPSQARSAESTLSHRRVGARRRVCRRVAVVTSRAGSKGRKRSGLPVCETGAFARGRTWREIVVPRCRERRYVK